MSDAANDNDPMSFIRLAIAVANVMHFLELDQKQPDKDAEQNRCAAKHSQGDPNARRDKVDDHLLDEKEKPPMRTGVVAAVVTRTGEDVTTGEEWRPAFLHRAGQAMGRSERKGVNRPCCKLGCVRGCIPV